MIQREIRQNNIRIFENKEEKYVDRKALQEKLQIDGFIRIQANEFSQIKLPLLHFNLQASGHVPGKTYGLIKIIEGGYFDGEKEVLPLLDMENIIIAKCTAAENNISYKNLEQSLEKFESKYKKEEVQELILARYTKSLPQLSNAEIIDAGVAITYLTQPV